MTKFLLRRLGEETLSVDLTDVGTKARTAPTQQFKSWEDAERYYLGLGATQENLDATHEVLLEKGSVVLTV